MVLLCAQADDRKGSAWIRIGNTAWYCSGAILSWGRLRAIIRSENVRSFFTGWSFTLFLITSVLAACESPRSTTVPSPATLHNVAPRCETPSRQRAGRPSQWTNRLVKCQFTEQNYDGPFTKASDGKLANEKIASVLPKTGGKTFVIISAGKQSGYGSFSVSDTNGNTLSVGVAHLSSARGNLCIQPKDKAQVDVPASLTTVMMSFLFKAASKG